MARGDFPSSKQDQFVLRFPDGLRDKIKSEAEATGRSMNAEIIARLESTFDPSADINTVNAAYVLVKEMHERLARYEDSLLERERALELKFKEERQEFRKEQNDRYLKRIEAHNQQQKEQRELWKERNAHLNEREKELSAAIDRVKLQEERFASLIAKMSDATKKAQ